MKSKAFILRQISELLEKNRGMCEEEIQEWLKQNEEKTCLLYTSPSPRDATLSRMPSSA